MHEEVVCVWWYVRLSWCGLHSLYSSEANDLALRLAREVTGGTEVIAIDGCVG